MMIDLIGTCWVCITVLVIKYFIKLDVIKDNWHLISWPQVWDIFANCGFPGYNLFTETYKMMHTSFNNILDVLNVIINKSNASIFERKGIVTRKDLGFGKTILDLDEIVTNDTDGADIKMKALYIHRG